MKRVFVDARMVQSIPHGIARYVTELMRGLREIIKINPLSYEICFFINESLDTSSLGSFRPFQTYPLESPFLSLREQFEIPAALKKLNASIYHSPSFASLWSCPCPSVLTLHDLNHLHFGDWKSRTYYRTILKKFARRSAVIATVSHFSRSEIASWLPCSIDSIQVAPNSVSFLQEATSHESNALSLFSTLGLSTKKYFFSLSNPKPHKNLNLLIQAYSAYRKTAASPLPLVLTVNDFNTVPGVHAVGSLDEKDASILLKHAAGMFFPSIYEGFGLPPVEAALVGIPVAVSDIAPHREGLQDLTAAEVKWVQPHDLRGWTQAFHELEQEKIAPSTPSQREKIINRFNAVHLAQTMDRIYQRVLSSSL